MPSDHTMVGGHILGSARGLECINRDAEGGETGGHANCLAASARAVDVGG